ncbi:hypothetical protein FOZ63_021921 [Perkinsus olseni]|nr:hypothetical protein FOZ63_021921 [Perkinsus olseni]
MRNRNADCSRHEKVIAKIWPNTHLDATRQALGTRDVESRMKKLVVEDAERESILLSQLADDGNGCAVRPLKTFTCQPGSEPVLVSTGCTSGATYFIREYCNYGDLSQYVTRCQDMYQIEGSHLGLRWYLSAKDAVRQAIECIRTVHDAGYALLDVDMSQFGVMDFRGYGSGLDLDGPQPIQVKIIDAGQATGLSTNSGSTIGKPSTRCPEAQKAAVQAERGIPPGERKHWSAVRQDTWAVGLMIFDLLWNSPWQLASADDPQYRLYRERGVRTLVKRVPSSSNRFGVAPRGVDMTMSLRDLLRGTLTACDKPGMFLSLGAVLASPWWQENDHPGENVDTPTTTGALD